MNIENKKRKTDNDPDEQGSDDEEQDNKDQYIKDQDDTKVNDTVQYEDDAKQYDDNTKQYQDDIEQDANDIEQDANNIDQNDANNIDQNDANDEDQDDGDDEDQDSDNPETSLQDNDAEILDSIAIARETYFFTYDNDNNEVNERVILKFIYEQIANIYTDRSLLQILGHIRYYYQIIFPEYERIVELFYLSVYPQAVMIDRRTAGLVQLDNLNNEVIDSYTNLLHNLINPSFDNSLNPFPIQSPVQSPRSSSLLNEIMFLSNIFNMRSNDSLLHVLNLMNNVIANNTESDEAQKATQADIKLLESHTFECIGTIYKDKNSDFCTICQENYEPSSLLKCLPCGHFFHCECIEPWLLNCSNLCPICRNKI